MKTTFVAQIIRFASRAAIILLLTRVFLGPDEYGLLFLAIAIFSIASLFGTIGIPKSTAKFFAEYREKDEGQLRHIVRFSAGAVAALTAVVSVAFFLVSGRIAAFYDEPTLRLLFGIGIVYIALRVAQGYLLIAFQGFGRVPLTAATRTISSVGQLGFIALFLSLGAGTYGALGGYIAGYALGVAFGAVFLYRIATSYPTSESIETGLRRRIVEYSLPLTMSQAGNVLYKRVDTLMVGFFLTPVAVGFYELAKQISTFVVAPADSLGFTVAPTFGEHKSASQMDRAARVYEQSFEYILLLYVPAVSGIVLLAEPGVRFVFGEEYLGAAPVLQVFAVFVFFQALDKITNDSLDYLGRATERAIGKGVTGVSNFGLNLVLIPTIGVVGAATSTAICFGLMVLYNVYLIHQELDLRLRRLANSIATTTAVTAVMTAVVVLLQPYVAGLVSLFGVIGVALAVWALCSVASGLIDVGEVRAHV